MSKALTSLMTSAKWRRGVSIAKQLPAKTVRAIEKDLRLLVAVERKGKPIPTTTEIAKYINGEYGLSTTYNLSGKWLDQIRNGQSIS